MQACPLYNPGAGSLYCMGLALEKPARILPEISFLSYCTQSGEKFQGKFFNTSLFPHYMDWQSLSFNMVFLFVTVRLFTEYASAFFVPTITSTFFALVIPV